MKLKVFSAYLIFLILSLLLFSCESDDVTGPVSGNIPAGTVQGYVKSLNGSYTVAGVRARILPSTVDADTQTVYSNVDGFYKFTNISSGDKTIFFRKGEFVDTIRITVPQNNGIQVPDARLEPMGQLAFVWGEYDEIQVIVRDSLGYNIDSISIADLSNLAALQNYGMIFLNCGSEIRNTTNTQLGAYIQGGGKVYASDWAFGCVKSIYPDLDGDYIGNVQNITANITNSDLELFLGKNTASIVYNLGAWLSLDTANNQSVYVPFLRGTYQTSSGQVTNNSIAFERIDGSGKLIYTTFHNEVNITTDAVRILMFFVYQL